MSTSHVIQAVDEQLALNAFFHGSPVPLQVGQVLEARCPRPVNKWMEPIEAFVERYRPEGASSRRCAMYSADDLEQLSDLAPSRNHIYEVEPIGPITQGDFAWIGGSRHYWGKDVEDAFMDMDHAKRDAMNQGYRPHTFWERIQAVRDYFNARARARTAAKAYWNPEESCALLEESYGDCPRQPEFLSPAIRILGEVT